jgi:hypothetical protein
MRKFRSFNPKEGNYFPKEGCFKEKTAKLEVNVEDEDNDKACTLMMPRCTNQLCFGAK